MIRKKENQLKAFTRCLFIIAWQRIKSVLVIPKTDNLFLPLGFYSSQFFLLLGNHDTACYSQKKITFFKGGTETALATVAAPVCEGQLAKGRVTRQSFQASQGPSITSVFRPCIKTFLTAYMLKGLHLTRVPSVTRKQGRK